MFKVLFTKTIWDGATPEASRTVALFQREETLPFAPTREIAMAWGRSIPEAPVGIRWEVKDQRFVCTMADGHPHSDGAEDYSFRDLLEEAKVSGWKLVTKGAV